MQVKLVSYSRPSDELINMDIKDGQELVAYCARVSNPDNQFNNETAANLIRYLVRHKHWSPLEMVNATLEIETTRDIARQMLRHRSFSFQEFSQRYADPTKELEFETRECRLQDSANRQNSTPSEDEELNKAWILKQQQIIHEAKLAYEWAIQNGIAKEQARCVLPEGNTKSRLYMNGTLRSWIHYIDLRSANGTQAEHAAIAQQCGKIIAEVFPLIDELFY